MRFVEALDPGRRVAAIPFQHRASRAAHRLSLAECEAVAWAFAAGGRRFRGAGAIAALAATLYRSRWPLLLYALPGCRQGLDWLYALVAANRSRLPGATPYCERRPEHCR